ncbi:MAG TPA: hypothetical protein PLO88_03370, partial [Bacilli bacterium]|nr:hypothetical protein [Bacilli bacterium]
MNKKSWISLFLGLCFLLVSCGFDTRNWPRIVLPFEREQLLEVSINYHKQPKGEERKTAEDLITTSDSEVLNHVYGSIINFPYQETIEKKIDSKNYWTKVVIILFYQVDGDTKEYHLTYYGYGVAKGIIVLNNGEAHFVPGDFV